MITLEQIKQLVEEETAKLNSIGLHPVKVTTIKIVKAQSFYADAWRGRGMIRVSYYYLTADISEIRATIMHELIHMIPSSGRGHGEEWKELAARVNENFPEYNIKRVGSNLKGGHNFSLRAAACTNAHSPKKLISCQCTQCKVIFTRTRESNLTLHPERYTCRCGGRIIRLY